MPTGYTAGVVDGTVTDLKTFALTCARGMGALIMMRDEPMDAEVPRRFEADTTWHDDRSTAARARLSELQAMDEAARAAACEKYNAEVAANNQRVTDETTEKRNRYNSMIAKVVQWEGAPEGLKEFMLEQLRSSRDFDCHDDPTSYMPKPMDIDTWFREELRKAAWDIEYHEGERAKEIGRTAERNAWLSRLHYSLERSK